MSGEGKLGFRGEDSQSRRPPVVHEDRLRESKLGGYALTLSFRHRFSAEEHAERVAAFSIFSDEDLEDVEHGHGG